MTAEATQGRAGLYRPRLPAGLEAHVHLSRLSQRWLLQLDLRAAQETAVKAGRDAPLELGHDAIYKITGHQDRALAVGGDLMPAPRQRWPDVPRAVARSIALETMAEREPEEAAKFKAMQREHKVAIADAKTRGQRAHQGEDFKAQRDQCVFLSRFFPVPSPGCWTLETWAPRQIRVIGGKLAGAIASIENHAEPAWFPDGWRESMAFFGKAVT